MKNGICPLCQSNDIYYRSFKSALSTSHRNQFTIPGTIFSIIALESYVCKNCGLVQDFIPSNKIEKVCNKLEKI